MWLINLLTGDIRLKDDIADCTVTLRSDTRGDVNNDAESRVYDKFSGENLVVKTLLDDAAQCLGSRVSITHVHVFRGSIVVAFTIAAAAFDVVTKWKDFEEGVDLLLGSAKKLLAEEAGYIGRATFRATSTWRPTARTITAVRSRNSQSQFARGSLVFLVLLLLLGAVILGVAKPWEKSDSDRLAKVEQQLTDVRLAVAELRGEIWHSAAARITAAQGMELQLRELQSRQLALDEIRKLLSDLKPPTPTTSTPPAPGTSEAPKPAAASDSASPPSEKPKGKAKEEGL